MLRRVVVALSLLAAARAGAAVAPSVEEIALDGRANIMEESHFGVVNGRISTGVPHRSALAVRGLYAPPFASSDFSFDVRLFGERVATSDYRWYPVEVRRSGMLRGIRVASETVLATGRRALLVRFSLANLTKGAIAVPIQLEASGSLDNVPFWGFARPATGKRKTRAEAAKAQVFLTNDAGAIALASDLPALVWEPWSSHWVTQVTLAPGARRVWHVAVAVGLRAEAARESAALVADATANISRAREDFARHWKDLFTRLPRLDSPNARLVNFYNRSLMHLILNRWDVPEFVLKPYYATGSVLGGCLGNYLWNYGEPWEIFPLYDASSAKAHIKQFLSIDLTRHFLFDPITGAGDGPHYPVNQEKIVHLIYFYVLHTGDTAFLHEVVAGKTVAEWAIFHALYGDDPSRPVALIDYGDGNHHLELRREYRYDFIVPDLNGRRYANYVLAARLARMAGRNHDYLLDRAEAIKRLLRRELWNPRLSWYDLITRTGARDTRYTVQVFKLIGSPVLGEEEQNGLLGHLNDKEFLSAYGLHSMSKLDPAYDQVDIDNGGGGICGSFVSQIAERLYKAGHPRQAEDLLGRVLWWGERIPYWGDSFVANQVDYRKDTPLQSAFDASAAAQMVIFGMFGISVSPEGSVVIDPHPPRMSPSLSLRGVRIRGRMFDVVVSEAEYEVREGGKTKRARRGTPITLQGL
jgi:hypothetical protein